MRMPGRNTRDLGKRYVGEAGRGQAGHKGFSEGLGTLRRAVRRVMKGNRMKSRLILHGWRREIRLYHGGTGSHLMALKSEDDINHTFWLMYETRP